MVEHPAVNWKCVGSTPTRSSITMTIKYYSKDIIRGIQFQLDLSKGARILLPWTAAFFLLKTYDTHQYIFEHRRLINDNAVSK